MIYAIITIISLIINAICIIYITSNMDIEVNFDKVNSINFRLAEQEHLTEDDKLVVVTRLINNLDFDKLEDWQKEGLKNKVIKKASN